MSDYIPVVLRRQVLAEAQGRCAYCQSQEALMGVTFEIDHIISLAVGGATELGNLCLACPPCNRHKSHRIAITNHDDGRKIPLFHPKQDQWFDHFSWNEDNTILLSLTEIGKVTIEALYINRPVIVQLRSYWVALARHP